MSESVKELLGLLGPFSVPELCDGMGLFWVMDYHMKPRIGMDKIIGPAFTVEVPSGEGALPATAILQAEPPEF